jgi:hypothetical protein
MKRVDLTEQVQSLAKKAAEAGDSADAMRFAQAACNAANAQSAINYSIANWSAPKGEEPEIKF